MRILNSKKKLLIKANNSKRLISNNSRKISKRNKFKTIYQSLKRKSMRSIWISFMRMRKRINPHLISLRRNPLFN